MKCGMSESKGLDAFKDAVAKAGGFRSVVFGSTRYLFVQDTEAKVLNQLRRKAVRTGEAIHFPDGSREWFEWVHNYDPKQPDEGRRYVWHRDGNRVRSTLFRKTVDASGKYAEQPVRSEWRPFLEDR